MTVRFEKRNPRAVLWTPMRCAVAACILDGMSQHEAAEAIGVSPTSVQRQELALRRRLGAVNRTQLAGFIGALA